MATIRENYYKNRGLGVNPLNEGLMEGDGYDGGIAADFKTSHSNKSIVNLAKGNVKKKLYDYIKSQKENWDSDNLKDIIQRTLSDDNVKGIPEEMIIRVCEMVFNNIRMFKRINKRAKKDDDGGVPRYNARRPGEYGSPGTTGWN
jgi:hypothetical protein